MKPEPKRPHSPSKDKNQSLINLSVCANRLILISINDANDSALDTLTRELREEEGKNNALKDELHSLQRVVGTHQYNNVRSAQYGLSRR